MSHQGMRDQIRCARCRVSREELREATKREDQSTILNTFSPSILIFRKDCSESTYLTASLRSYSHNMSTASPASDTRRKQSKRDEVSPLAKSLDVFTDPALGRPSAERSSRSSHERVELLRLQAPAASHTSSHSRPHKLPAAPASGRRKRERSRD
jgi:hypothetical protein